MPLQILLLIEARIQDCADTLGSLMSFVGDTLHEGSTTADQSMFSVDSLQVIVCHIQRSEEAAIGVNFIGMLNLVQFVAKIEAI
jgi:hypothetical protein